MNSKGVRTINVNRFSYYCEILQHHVSVKLPVAAAVRCVKVVAVN
jgi:hypothetical protein